MRFIFAFLIIIAFTNAKLRVKMVKGINKKASIFAGIFLLKLAFILTITIVKLIDIVWRVITELRRSKGQIFINWPKD